MANKTNECQFDTDCDGTLVCIKDVSWLDDDYESKCDCDGWFGFSGENCTEFGPGATYYMTSACIQLVLALGCLTVCTVIIVRAFKADKLKGNAAIGTLALATLASVLAVCWRAVIIYILSTHTDRFGEITIESYGRENVKQHPTANFEERAIIGLTIVFALAAAMNISLIWINTATKAAKLTQKDQMANYRKAIIGLEIFWVIGAGTLFIIGGGGAFVFYLGALYIVIICSSYWWGERKLIPLLESMGAGTGKYGRIVKNIRITTLYIYVGGGILLVAGIAYSVMSVIKDNREYSPSGQISPVMATNELLPLGVIIATMGVIRYLFFSIATGNTSSSKRVTNNNSEKSTRLEKKSSNYILTRQVSVPVTSEDDGISL